MNSKSGLSLFVAIMLVLSVIFAYGVSLAPVYASTGAPKLGAVAINPTVDNYNASSVVVANNYVSIKAGSSNVSSVDGVANSNYFAIIFKINDTQLVTFSGSQFDLYISKDGYSSISSGDLKYASGFLVSDLQGNGLKNVTSSITLNSNIMKGEGSFWIGTINDTSTGTTYEVLIGPVPYRVSADYKYVKVFDGSSSSVAVSIQTIKLLAAISLTPTSGPGGTEVTLEGYALNANSLINITYVSPVSKLIAQVTTDDMGHFSYTWKMVDLKSEFTGSSCPIPADTVTISVVYNETGTLVDSVDFSEFERAFLQIISYKYGDTAHDFTGYNCGWGNNTVYLNVYVFDTVRVAGIFFNPNDNITVKLGNKVMATAVPNATGFFNVTFTVPELTVGNHEVDVWNNGVYYNFTLVVHPTMILSPIKGPVGTKVSVSVYGFPEGTVFIYWYEKALGDNTYYNIVNGTVGSNGKFVSPVTFTVPHAYGGIPHNVTAVSNATSYYQGAENTTILGAIASANFTITPELKIVPSSFSNDGSLVKVVGTGLNPSSAYVPNIDNNLLGVDVDWSGYPTDVYSPLVNSTGDMEIYFVAAGFTPGLHVFSLYENETLKPLYVTFTVEGPSPDTQTVLNEISSSKSDILSAISSSSSDILSAIGGLSDKLDALSSKIDDAVNAVNNAVDALNNVVNQLPSIVNSSVSQGLSALSDKLDEGFANMSETLGSMSTSLSDMSSALGNMQSGISSLQSGLSSLSDAMSKSASDTASFLLAIIVLVVITLIFAAAAAVKVFKG